jgi:2-dehydro-3-deoxygalactonokinase
MIAVDWGTSSLRLFRLDQGGRVIESRHSAEGVLAAQDDFGNVLLRHLHGWDDGLIVMSGMIGSRQGWREVPYVACPAGIGEIAAGMQELEDHGLPGRRLWIAPGLSLRRADGQHDLMRGEETQVCGLLAALTPGTHQVCLPGTHSKHVRVENGRVMDFRTFMTGEVFELLCRHSILGRLMQPGPYHEVAFRRGVDLAAQQQDLLAHLFAVRTQGLVGEINPAWLESYLSGILIGHELNGLADQARQVQLVASSALVLPYRAALRRRGFDTVVHQETAAAQGLYALVAARGLRGPSASS